MGVIWPDTSIEKDGTLRAIATAWVKLLELGGEKDDPLFRTNGNGMEILIAILLAFSICASGAVPKTSISERDAAA